MKRIVLAVLALAFVVSCKPKECPPPQPAPTCPEATCDVAFEDAGQKLTSPAWRLVEQDGKMMLTTTLADKRVIAVPIAPTTSLFVDGKESTGETLLKGPGGCPCRLLQCMPYCRPIGDVLSPTPQPAPPQ